MPVELTKDTYDEFINAASTPVIVDFWAPWCGPCHRLSPAIEDLSVEMAEEVSFAKVNIDDFPELGARHEIRSIPALILFKGGEYIGRIQLSGSFAKQNVQDHIRIAIAGDSN